jgi:hypothetical protein
MSYRPNRKICQEISLEIDQNNSADHFPTVPNETLLSGGGAVSHIHKQTRFAFGQQQKKTESNF